jgi:hypothetical protein
MKLKVLKILFFVQMRYTQTKFDCSCLRAFCSARNHVIFNLSGFWFLKMPLPIIDFVKHARFAFIKKTGVEDICVKAAFGEKVNQKNIEIPVAGKQLKGTSEEAIFKSSLTAFFASTCL